MEEPEFFFLVFHHVLESFGGLSQKHSTYERL